MKDPNSKQVATEEYLIDFSSLAGARWNDDTRTEIADDLIKRFLCPVRLLTIESD
jgi:hypothetical protein